MNIDDTGKTPALEQFLSDPVTLDLLAHPFKAFSEPSQQTKSALETKTSAINVTPSSNARYDIKEVKEDALWLSKEAKIDEMSALRIVVEEYQSRPSAQLLGRFSNEELVSIQEAAGSRQFLGPLALLSQGADSDAIQKDFDTQENRRLRILRTYLSERRNILQCVNILLQNALYQGSGSGKGKERELALSWVSEIGNNLIQEMGGAETWVLESLTAVENNVENINNGSGWYNDEGGREDIEIEWVNNQIMEATHTMEIIFQIIDNMSTICSSATVLAWLQVATKYNFFDQFTTVCSPISIAAEVC